MNAGESGSVTGVADRTTNRVVPSPFPREIIELAVIRNLAADGTVVIACGGGGLPVVRNDNGDLDGVEAVRASAGSTA